jgi:hypothetical protein
VVVLFLWTFDGFFFPMQRTYWVSPLFYIWKLDKELFLKAKSDSKTYWISPLFYIWKLDKELFLKAESNTKSDITFLFSAIQTPFPKRIGSALCFIYGNWIRKYFWRVNPTREKESPKTVNDYYFFAILPIRFLGATLLHSPIDYGCLTLHQWRRATFTSKFCSWLKILYCSKK